MQVEIYVSGNTIKRYKDVETVDTWSNPKQVTLKGPAGVKIVSIDRVDITSMMVDGAEQKG